MKQYKAMRMNAEDRRTSMTVLGFLTAPLFLLLTAGAVLAV
jgi:hypothetical protein